MSLLLNIIWILLGGAWMAFGWLVAAVIMAVTIVGIPWARAAINIALYTLMPFGYTAVPRDRHTGQGDIGTGPLGATGPGFPSLSVGRGRSLTTMSMSPKPLASSALMKLSRSVSCLTFSAGWPVTTSTSIPSA
mgnify:CR=1 FL=1